MHREPTPILAVGGVVYRQNAKGQLELLLIKKKGGFWTLPKGRVKRGEPLLDALRREVQEETGLEGPVGSEVQSVTYTIVKRGTPCRKQVIYYLLAAQSGRLRPEKREKIEKIGWFPVAQALRRIGRDRVRAVAHQAVDLLSHTPEQASA